MNKLSKRSLIILIAILSTAIIVMLALLSLKETSLSVLDNFADSSNPTASQYSSSEYSSSESTEKSPVVVIDAGHGGWEPGAGNGSTNEKDVALAISLEIEKILKEKNIDYYMIRENDTYVSLEDRVKLANEKSCKLFVSIHNNSFTDSSQSGILTTYNPYSPNGKKIAEIMQSKIENIGMRNRKVMQRPNLYVLRHTDMPALLLEIGFISNKKDLQLLTDANFQQKCAQQIVLGIEEIVTAEAESSEGD